MAPMGPTLLDEVPLLPRLLLCELYLLEQSVQVHPWPLVEPLGSVCFVRAPGGSPQPGPQASASLGLRQRPGDTAEGTRTRLRGHRDTEGGEAAEMAVRADLRQREMWVTG